MNSCESQKTLKVDNHSSIGSELKCQQTEDLARVQLIYKNMLDKNPNNTEALYWFGALAQRLQKLNSAIAFFSKIIELDVHEYSAILQRGRTYMMQKKHQLAIADFTKALTVNPKSLEAFYSRGIAQSREANFEAAINDFTSALKITPNSADAYYNRALASKKLNKFDQAVKDYTRAIELKHDHFQALNNRGLTHREMRNFKKAIADFDRCIITKPDFAEGYLNKALTHLMVGEYEEAWRLYEYRWSSESFPSKKRRFDQPLWLGAPRLKNKTILLHSEQGLGDTLQFCRYVDSFDTSRCNILLEVERPLMTIMESLLPKSQIIEKGANLPNFDYHCPLMSLPLAFKTTIETIPSPSPYLYAEPERVMWWSNHLGVKTRPRIGLVWQGNPCHSNDEARSIKLAEIIDYLSPKFDWYSLQIRISDNDKILIGNINNLIHFGEMIGDFAETAAFCTILDAVICVDTSIAHLAGAIGRPTHLLLPHLADSRWHDQSKRSPWYDSLMIYRKGLNHDWSKPLNEAIDTIGKLHENEKHIC